MHVKGNFCNGPLHQELFDTSWCCLTCRSQVAAEILRQPEVLIVTRDFELTQALGIILHEEGYQIYLAPDLTTAAEEMSNYHFDLVIIQWGSHQPEAGGLVHRARQGEHPAKVMALSSQGPVWPAAAFEVEIDDYLAFPFTTGELRRRVAALLQPSCPGPGMELSPADRINARVLESLHLLLAKISHSLVKAGTSLKTAGAQASWSSRDEAPNPMTEAFQELARALALIRDFHRNTSLY